MNIFLTGGSGLLGKELIDILKQKYTLCYPVSNECDIRNKKDLVKYFEQNDYDICIHCAALVSISQCEEELQKAIETNIVGTCNLVQECAKQNIKLIYISTTHVFDGKHGYYNIDDPINPIGKYAKSKAAGELAVRMYDNSLVIRTEFFGKNFPYKVAFTDRWASKDYIDIIAPKIAEASTSSQTGIVHIGSKRRSLYQIAKERNPDVLSASVRDTNLNVPILFDTSLKLENENGE